MSLERFYTGAHHPHWLASPALPAEVSLFVSHRRLAGRTRMPKARVRWALDSGGFSELSMFGGWRTSPEEYVAAVHRYDTEIGMLDWAAIQDHMCEGFILAKTGRTVDEHLLATRDSFLTLRDLWGRIDPSDELRIQPEHCVFQPGLQGFDERDYLRCADMYADAGVDLTQYPIVTVGSVCRRQGTAEIGAVFETLSGLGLALHGFGVKQSGLRQYGQYLTSADSMAWSFEARRQPPLQGCSGHKNCANCMRYALRWRERLLGSLDAENAPYQPALPLWSGVAA